MKKLSRKEIREGLQTVPIEGILGKGVSSQLTAKQKRFALEVAKGATKAEAYRRAYDPNPAPSTLLGEPYRVAANPKVAAEIEAYQAAIEAAKYRTPAALRELVIQSLVSVVINPETKDSVKVAAAKVLGTVTEVAAFTERKEVRTISSSEDAKQKIMGELKRIITDSATDATIIETQADELLRELSGPESSDAMPNADAISSESLDPVDDAISAGGDPHPPATPPCANDGPAAHVHSIPLKQSSSEPISSHPAPSENAPDGDPTPQNGEDPPSEFKLVP